VTISGLVHLDGRPLADVRVLAVSDDATTLLGSTTTRDDGQFAVDVPEAAGGRVVLLVKVQGPVIALAQQPVDLAAGKDGTHELRLASDAPTFHTVRGRVATTSGWPPYLTIFVNPIQVEGIDPGLARFFNRQDERVVESTFFKQRLDGQEFELRVQAGTYAIGGSHLNYQRPNLANPDFENYVVARVEADGEPEPLPGNPSSGYRLDVTREREITMTLEVVPDEALSPGGL
jgi:hypothetical protein